MLKAIHGISAARQSHEYQEDDKSPLGYEKGVYATVRWQIHPFISKGTSDEVTIHSQLVRHVHRPRMVTRN